MSKIDKEIVDGLLSKGASIETIAEVVGDSATNVKRFINDNFKISKQELTKNNDNATKVQSILQKMKILSLDDISKRTGLKKPEIYQAIDTLHDRSIFLERNRNGNWYISTTPQGQVFHYKANRKEKIGLISDTHLGSNYMQLTHLNAAYDIFVKEGIRTVFHSGDLFDGHKIYRGQEYEQFANGYDSQLAYGVENYPKRKGITTKVISGNHDLTFENTTEADIVHALSKEREDIEYMGRIEATIKIGDGNGLNFYMLHPAGGNSYARSYRVQKIIEAMTPERKPHIAQIGHLHISGCFTVRNVKAILANCFPCWTPIVTSTGTKPINKIKEGDLVLTHKNRFKKVTHIFKHLNDERITVHSYRQHLVCTPEHPILTLRKGIKEWICAKDLLKTDYVFVVADKCVCGNIKPKYRKYCFACSPMSYKDKSELRKIATEREEKKHKKLRKKLREVEGFKIKNLNNSFSGTKHYEGFIIPYLSNHTNTDTIKYIPIHPKCIPDVLKVSIENNKLVIKAIELETETRYMDKKVKNYSDWGYSKFFDGIECSFVGKAKPENKYFNSHYIVDDEVPGFVAIPVTKIEYKKNKNEYINRYGKYAHRTNFQNVFNIEVEEDNSYVANNFVVHNCFQAQTPYLQAKGLEPVIGCWILGIDDIDISGTVRSFSIKEINFFIPKEKDY